MTLQKMVKIKGYEMENDGDMPVYLADEITEDVGGKKDCKLHVAIATLSEKDKVYGKDNHIIVVDKYFLRLPRKTKLALILYHNELLRQMDLPWKTQKGPEMGARAEVVTVYGKFRFTRAFRKLNTDERKAIRRCTGGLHHQYKVNARAIKKNMKKLGLDIIDDPAEDSAVDLVAYYMQQEQRKIKLNSYKGVPLDAGNIIDPECREFNEEQESLDQEYGDEIEGEVAAEAEVPKYEKNLEQLTLTPEPAPARA